MLSAASFMSTAYTAPIKMGGADAPIKLGVNGFGRIGRQVVRIAVDRESFVLKHINSPMAPEYMKYLLEHDTVHGLFLGTCAVDAAMRASSSTARRCRCSPHTAPPVTS